MRTIVYRRSLSFTSGAGQLIAMQVRALRAAGINTELVCQRGGWRFWLRSGLRARHVTAAASQGITGTPERLVVDHGMELPGAQIVFAHNLMSEARHFLDRPDIDFAAEQEHRFFSALNSEALVVANSQLVRKAIAERFQWPDELLKVCYPGYRKEVFSSERRAALRIEARKALGISADTPLIGFVTSGDLHKRGLGLFIDAATEMLTQRPDLRFLVTGSQRLPDWMHHHTLLTRGRLLHRARGTRPELWMSALDVFLFPARFEEFGMVVLEACALGVPVITSRRVGAAECLPDSYSPWICGSPDPRALADLGLRLLSDAAARASLSSAGIAAADTLSDLRYAQESLSIISSRLKAAA
jgi:glycosyltransferase involved in cell wall biosynthesis